MGQVEAQWLPTESGPVQGNEAVITVRAHQGQLARSLVESGPAIPKPNGPRVGIDQAPVQVADLETATKLVAGHPRPVEQGVVAHLPAGQVLSGVFDRRRRAAHLFQPDVVVDHTEAAWGRRPGPRGNSVEE